jgi:type VI secretion system secreted protein Hcp
VNKLTIAGLSLVATVAATMPAGAAGTTVGSSDSVFVSVKGAKTGNFAGDASNKLAPKGQQMVVYHLEFGGIAPRDPASGLASGKRQWSQVKFIKSLDKASPQFFNSFASNEQLSTVVFTVVGPSRGLDGKATAGGAEVPLYTVTLTNASIASDQVIAPSQKDPASGVAYAGAVEEVSLTFQKIEVMYVQGGITAGADWASPI